MLHPVGHLPAAVYWRRRLLVLALLVSLIGGGTWLVVALVGGDGDGASAAPAGAAEAASQQPVEPPALDQVVPPLPGVRTPTPAPEPAPPEPEAGPASEAESGSEAGPEPGGPCTDEMIGLEVRAPESAAPGEKPTFELVVTNTSPVPCVRALDKELQEIVLLDRAGERVWGSNDCFPESTDDTRTLQPDEAVSFSLVWGGLTSEPSCTEERTPPDAGNYALRGRLDTRTSGDTPFRVV